MTDPGKDKREFEYIKKQVVPKRGRKFKKWFKPFLMTVFMAIIFGLVAAITFSVTEPRFYKRLNKEEDNRKPIIFPSEYPEDDLIDEGQENKEGLKPQSPSHGQNTGNSAGPNSSGNEGTVVEKKIDAKAEDLISIYEDIRKIGYEANKSIVKIDSIKDGKDLFGNSSEIRKATSGVIIADLNGELAILVSYDRINSASRVQLVFSDQVMVDAKLLDYDEELNIAILNVMIKGIPSIYYNNLKVAQLGESYSTTVGTPIIALGNPNGYYGALEIGHITSKVSYLSTIDNRIELFNTSVVDNENSDGVIVNLEGKIVGVITRIQTGDVNDNVNTAIGISRLKSILQKLANNEPRIYMGAVIYELTDAAREDYDVKRGVYVSEVISNSPASDGGLKSGDIIMLINEKEVFNINSYNDILNEYKAGDQVLVKVIRTSAYNREMDFKITLGQKN